MHVRLFQFSTLLLFLVLLCASSALTEVENEIEPCTQPNTTSLQYSGDGRDLHETYRALITCPNITDVDIRLDWAGCSPPEDVWYFDFQDGDRFPPLKRLKISGYDWHERPVLLYHPPVESMQSWLSSVAGYWPLSKFQSLFKPPPPPRLSNIEKWQRAQDFSALQHLQVLDSQEYFFRHMEGKLPGLRSLDVNWHDVSGVYKDFLLGLPSLQELHLHLSSLSFDVEAFPLTDILARHGSTLESLTITSAEVGTNNESRATLTPSHIQSIREACPRLTSLAIDVERNGTWGLDALDALASIPSLSHLHIGVELGGRADLPPDVHWTEAPFFMRYPLVTPKVAQSIFRYVGEQKNGVPLETFDIEVGNWPLESYMGPLAFDGFDECLKRLYKCGKGPIEEQREQKGGSLGDEAEEALDRDYPCTRPFKNLCIGQGGWGSPDILGFDVDAYGVGNASDTVGILGG